MFPSSRFPLKILGLSIVHSSEIHFNANSSPTDGFLKMSGWPLNLALYYVI
jgi:hypothetical protein